ncbi:MAG: uridine kinase [Reichenbachiella sp.]
MSKHLLIGITGGSGSGKTYLLEQIKKAFSEDEICIISQDNYYKPIDQQVSDSNGIENFDLPGSIDNESFASDIARLKSGKSIERKEYSFNNSASAPRMLKILPAPIIIAEGIFVFHDQSILRSLDFKVFVDSDLQKMLKRRIQRDAIERGYDINDVRYRYQHHVLPAYKQYILPYKKEADFTVQNDNNNIFLQHLNLLIEKIKALHASKKKVNTR